jgi:hypothetical protein
VSAIASELSCALSYAIICTLSYAIICTLSCAIICTLSCAIICILSCAIICTLSCAIICTLSCALSCDLVCGLVCTLVLHSVGCRRKCRRHKTVMDRNKIARVIANGLCRRWPLQSSPPAQLVRTLEQGPIDYIWKVLDNLEVANGLGRQWKALEGASGFGGLGWLFGRLCRLIPLP